MLFIFFDKKTSYKERDLTPDEIFLDSKNLPQFNRERLEGRINTSIPERVSYLVFFIFLCVFLVFFVKLFKLQIISAKLYQERSLQNHLREIPIYSKRGVIYDRFKKELAWNMAEERDYIKSKGFGHLLGYLGYGEKGNVKSGLAGLEKALENRLFGKTGVKIEEADSKNNLISEYLKEKPQDGENVVLTIDGDLQETLFAAIEEIALAYGFKGGAGVILNPENGEMLALTSYPEYNAIVLSRGGPKEEIEKFLSEPKKPFFNRASDGLYPPGSSFKPLIALAGLNEGIIDPDKKILTNGYLAIPNPYETGRMNIFPDWKNHGWVDMTDALAVSSNVYFYILGGGFEDQPGLGINKIIKYARIFGFEEKTGIEIAEKTGFIPTPDWKKENIKNDPLWRLGDTYNASIGQGYILTTPVQMAKFISIIAKDGKTATPHLIFDQKDIKTRNLAAENKWSGESFKIVKQGLEKAVISGTAQALAGLGIEVAGKTGTAQTGKGKLIDSWFIGYLPAENPKIAMAIVLEEGDGTHMVGAPAVSRKIVEWLVNNRKKEYNL